MKDASCPSVCDRQEKIDDHLLAIISNSILLAGPFWRSFFIFFLRYLFDPGLSIPQNGDIEGGSYLASLVLSQGSLSCQDCPVLMV